ncbi:hypothetical protein [Litoribacillus peritrichatus]|uniref:Uncharacterized protein n=1 Tax=Litoribacillus peritrichatus TaxID=718191 RepID=A0ABP7M2J1_9GAMM
MINKLAKYADHFFFAGANILLGSCVAKYGTEGAFNNFVLGVTIALFVYGFIKFVFVNALAVGVIKFSKNTVAGLSVYHLCFSLLGIICYYYETAYADIVVFATFLISVYLGIDYYRFFFIEKGSYIKSPLFSVLFFFFVSINYCLSSFLDVDYLQFSMCVAMLILFVISFIRFIFSGRRGEFGKGVGEFHSCLYWLANSMLSHAPVVFMSLYKPKMAAGFYALRTIFNVVSTFLRPKEVDFRLSLKYGVDERKEVLAFLRLAFLMFWGVAVIVSLLRERIFETLYSDSFDLNFADVLVFSLYMLLNWMPLLLEGIATKQGNVRKLSEARFYDLVLLFIVLAGCYLIDADFILVVFVLMLSAIPSYFLLFRVVSVGNRRGCEG